MLIDTSQFWLTALFMAISSIPIVFIGLMFLHAARAPQWVWAFSNRRQVVWIVILLGGIAVTPIGIPVALWYLLRIRPDLDAIERGQVGWAESTGESLGD